MKYFKSLNQLRQLGVNNFLSNKKLGDISTILRGNGNGKAIVDKILRWLNAEFLVMPLVCHGNNIASLNEQHNALSYYEGKLHIIKNYDGLHYEISPKARPIVLGITTADCPTVVLARHHREKIIEVVIIHVGRKPLLAGILEKGFALISYGKGKIYAGINPGISGKYYQLNNDHNIISAAMREFQKKYPRQKYPDVYPQPDSIDLRNAIICTLIELGLAPNRIEVLNHCSYKDRSQHSLRRDQYPLNDLKLDALFIKT